MITNAAMKNGFTGGLIVDFPNSKKAKKYYLFLMAGYSEEIQKDAKKAIYMPKAKTEGEEYSDSSDSEMDSDEENSDEEDKAEEEESSSDDEKIGISKKKKDTKFLQKARRQEGRFKANGNRKNKAWIMKKKARQQR